MQKCIATLENLGHISQIIHQGRWMFKALLAPKPHQEHVMSIDEFVLCFCVNYIPLNSVTRIIVNPILRCGSAVLIDFDGCKNIVTIDAPQGYFAGVDAIKWPYNMMPFGPVNGQPIFIMMMHDLYGTWIEICSCQSCGINVGKDAHTCIIVDDILNFFCSFSIALAYIRCILEVCRSQNLSLCLCKCMWFPERVEFVGIDVCPDGNHPA
jgi:hypothetical protein